MGCQCHAVWPQEDPLIIRCHLTQRSLSSAGGVLDAQAESQLERDERWGASRFAGLEQFIYNYLTGGESAGERVRLKLQTPLYVTDALLEAAEKQMSEELEGAEQVQLAGLGALQAQLLLSAPDACWSHLRSSSRRAGGSTGMGSETCSAQMLLCAPEAVLEAAELQLTEDLDTVEQASAIVRYGSLWGPGSSRYQAAA